ncbi:hypothetical protein [Rhodococcus triatomae]|uniref:hypothetical protein n=1 Tax=Rhodococcus triatomae TaxID=300028 RepID=UPI000AE1CBBC|nr:hypothetical protein [Rhodococcus triatomae]
MRCLPDRQAEALRRVLVDAVDTAGKGALVEDRHGCPVQALDLRRGPLDVVHHDSDMVELVESHS